ncbi:MAG: transposase family protein [Treponema sp.]|nr:transposase family protein [Treponema sp.]
MNRYEKAGKLNDDDFKQITGVKKETFGAMAEVLRGAYAQKHRRRGRHAKLPIEDQLFMSLKYWRQYVTQKEPAFEFEAGEAAVHDTIVRVENTPVKSGAFSLPGRKALLEANETEAVLVDVTESPAERPKKNSRNGIPAKRNAIP